MKRKEIKDIIKSDDDRKKKMIELIDTYIEIGWYNANLLITEEEYIETLSDIIEIYEESKARVQNKNLNNKSS